MLRACQYVTWDKERREFVTCVLSDDHKSWSPSHDHMDMRCQHFEHWTYVPQPITWQVLDELKQQIEQKEPA